MYSWRNDRVLITGATGFIGSHLMQSLKNLGASVIGLASEHVSDHIVKCDVRNLKELQDIFNKNEITMCFHLAGLAQVETGQHSPHPTFDINITGALNILECSRQFRVKKTILASTSHVYGENKVPYQEEYTPRPTRPYETSKACIDLLAMSYARTYRVPVYIARFVNIYGPGDLKFARLIPKTIRSVLKGESPEMWGGRAIRDYLYIDDAIAAYIKLGEIKNDEPEKEHIFNFGSSNLLSVRDIVERIIKYSDMNVKIHKIADLRENEIPVQYVSWKKAKKVLGWEPKVDFETGIKKALDWYKDYFNSHI
jgi:CDP-glucose 4,6-dehydratase